MRPDNGFLVSSARGDVLHLRQHAFAFLSNTQEDAVCFEPSLLAKNAARDAHLSVSADENQFSWTLSPDHRAGTVGSTSVVLLGHRGGQAVTGRVAQGTAHSAWKEWAGCDSIDISTADDSGSLQGDSLTLAIPAQPSLITFSQTSAGHEIAVMANTPNPELLRVTLWHRVQNDQWLEESSDFDLPADGLRILTPVFQGAIVVEGPGGGLEGLQFFGFKRLHDGDKADRAYIEQRYAKRRRQPVDAWPLWFQNYFLKPFHVFQREEEVSAAEVVRKLRTEIRKSILAPIFSKPLSDWRPDLTIEDFTRTHRPELAKLVASGQDTATLRLASEVQDSPDLVRAIRWAGNPSKSLAACLRLLPIETSARHAQQSLSPFCVSWGPLEKLRSALDDVPASGTSLEASVRELHEDLARAVVAEFQTPLERLTRDHVLETRLNLVVQELFALLNISATSASLPERLRLLASGLEAGRMPGLSELVDKGLEIGLLERSWIDDPSGGHAYAIDEFKTILQDPSPLVDEDLRKRLLQTVSDPASLRGFLCTSQIDAIRSVITKRAAGLDTGTPDRLLDLQRQNAGLSEWLEYGIAQASQWTGSRAVFEEDRLRQEQLRLLLPENMDPDSKIAEEWLANQGHALVDQITELVAAFAGPLTEQDTAILENAAAILRHVLSPNGEHRLARMCDIQTLMRQGETSLAAIADRLMVHELPTNGKGSRPIRHFFRERKYGLARKLIDLAAVQSLLSRHHSLPNRAWLDEDEDFGKKMIQMYKALQNLDKLDSGSEVDRLLTLWEENRAKIDRRGDLPRVFQHWEDQLHRRIGLLRDDLAASGLLPPSSINIFKFIHSLESRSSEHAEIYKPGSLIDGIEPELLSAKLVEHRIIRPSPKR